MKNTFVFTEEAASLLVTWYDTHHRDLPWRKNHDAYRVWVSEIMLQQTRVEAVIPKYLQFMETLPDIHALAEVEDDVLMRLWEGMGYYSRARSLKKCALEVCTSYNGLLPQERALLQKLPGIGPYTSGAIASIAWGKKEPAVDGNVLRVLARLSALEEDIRSPQVREHFEETMQSYYRTSSLTEDGVRSLTQGFMDLGAMVCIPNGAPHCEVCPWHTLCLAHLQNKTDVIPFRSKPKKRRIEKKTVLVIRDGSRFLLKKRPDTGLLAGLYEFPNVEGSLSKKQAASAVEAMGFEAVHVTLLPETKHIFSHIEWHMKIYEVQISQFHEPEGLLVTKEQLQDTAVPSAFRAVLNYYDLR